jgi:hypothetical protein
MLNNVDKVLPRQQVSLATGIPWYILCESGGSKPALNWRLKSSSLNVDVRPPDLGVSRGTRSS